MAEASAQSAPSRAGRGRHVIVVMAIVALAPIVLSTVIYFFYPQPAGTNYGRLLPVGPAPELAGRTAAGTPFRVSALQGKWVLLMAGAGACDASCRNELFATRQARTMQGPEIDRLVRVWLVTDAAVPPQALLLEHPGLIVAHAEPGMLARLPAGPDAIYLIDPLGNLVLQYPEQPDVKALAKDLKRLLRASSIG